MKKLTAFVLGGFLLFSAAACSETEKTSANAPSASESNVEAPDADTAKANQNDATSPIRRDQLNSDIRAREQRNNAAGNPLERADSDLASEVRSKLEANLPASSLTVEAEEGIVTVNGVVPTQPQYDRIEPLAKEIKGVKSVKVKAVVAPAKPEENKEENQNRQ